MSVNHFMTLLKFIVMHITKAQVFKIIFLWDFLASSLTAKVFTSNLKEIHFENFVVSVGAKKSMIPCFLI